MYKIRLFINKSIIAKKLELYDREYYFYTNISGKMNIKIPRFYNLTVDKNAKLNGIVLENLFDKLRKIEEKKDYET